MFVSRILLRHFRCFDGTHVISFSKKGPTALIGPNNVGKSTVLQALDILLGDRWPTNRLAEEDYYNNDFSQPITLACEFSESIETSYYGSPVSVRGLVLTASHLSTGVGEAAIEADFFPLAAIRDFENMEWDVAMGLRGNKVRVSQELKNGLPIVVTVPLIKLSREQPSNKWGVLGRMMQKIERRFSQDHSAEESFKEKIHEAVEILRGPEEFQALEGDLKRLWEDMKPANLGDTSLEFLDFEPWRYYRQFRLAIRKGLQDVPIDTLGEGVQRLAVIALYRAYLRRHGRNQRAILLIEEPESYLHPQARTTVFHVLHHALAADDDAEGQIIYTTHSEDFIDCAHFGDVTVFGQNGGAVVTRRVTTAEAIRHALALNRTDQPLMSPQIFYRLLETSTVGLKEALFAQKAIIVEGLTDLELFGLLSESHRSQIAIVAAGGKSNVPAVMMFLTGFGVPCLVAIDRDNENTDDNERIAEALSQSNAQIPDDTAMTISLRDIEAVADDELWTQGRLMVLGRNVETLLKSKVPNHAALVDAIRGFTNVPPSKKPKLMRAIGLAYRGALKDATIEREMAIAKPALEVISNALTDFARQEVSIPELLFPKPSS